MILTLHRMHFNTSNVTIQLIRLAGGNQGIYISIHLMLLFNNLIILGDSYTTGFQYI